MNKNFKNACKMAIGEAIIKIGNMPEYEKCSIIDIKKGLAEVLKRYIEIEAKNMSLEGNSDIYDPNNNIKIFTNYDHKESENKDNGHKYICAIISNRCFNTDSNYREPIKLKYLLNRKDCLIGNKDFEYLFQDKKYKEYFISDSPVNATVFKDNEVEDVCLSLMDEFGSAYLFLKMNSDIYPKESILNKTFVLYHYNNYTINDVKEMFFYLKDTISSINNGIFYDKLKEDGSYKVTNDKKEAMVMSFNGAMSLLVALTILEPEEDWKMEEYSEV